MGLEGYSGRPGRDRGGLFDACMYRPGYNVTFQLYQYDGNDNYSDYYGSLHG